LKKFTSEEIALVAGGKALKDDGFLEKVEKRYPGSKFALLKSSETFSKKQG